MSWNKNGGELFFQLNVVLGLSPALPHVKSELQTGRGRSGRLFVLDEKEQSIGRKIFEKFGRNGYV